MRALIIKVIFRKIMCHTLLLFNAVKIHTRDIINFLTTYKLLFFVHETTVQADSDGQCLFCELHRQLF